MCVSGYDFNPETFLVPSLLPANAVFLATLVLFISYKINTLFRDWTKSMREGGGGGRERERGVGRSIWIKTTLPTLPFGTKLLWTSKLLVSSQFDKFYSCSLFQPIAKVLKYYLKYTTAFINFIKQTKLDKNKILVSMDVTSLF